MDAQVAKKTGTTEPKAAQDHSRGTVKRHGSVQQRTGHCPFAGVAGLSNDADFTYYSGAPSPRGIAYPFAFAADDRAFMNVTAGVGGAISLFYSSPSAVVGALKAYSGLDGTGTLLGTLDLAGNATSGYDVWTPVTFNFDGIAESFDLTASANVVGFDDIASVSPVPEPSSALMLLAGGAVLIHLHRRRSC